MSKRPSIPAEITREVLIGSGHRCAVCGAGCPLERAHIIPWHKSREHKAEDLICLCANCHQRADLEKWGEKTLRDYKRKPWVLRHYEKAEIMSEPTTEVELTIKMKLKNFDENLKRWLQSALAGFLGISPSAIRITSIEKSSVKVTIELPTQSAERLLSAYKRNDSELLKYLAPLVLLDLRRKKAERERILFNNFITQRWRWTLSFASLIAFIVTVAFALLYSRVYVFFEVPFLSRYVLGVLAILVILDGVTASLRWKEAREGERTIFRLKAQLEEAKEGISHLQKQLQEQRIPFIVGLEHLTKARPEFLPIIQKLFITFDRIESIDITPLPGGYGGSVTFVARIGLESEDQLLPEPFVLKLGAKREMKDEDKKWRRFVQNRFVDAPRAMKYESLGDYAGVSYTFAGLGGEIQNFHKFYEGHFHTEIVKVIGELYQNTEKWREGGPKGIKEITGTNLYDEYHLLYNKRGEIIVGINKIMDRDDSYSQNFYAPTALLVPGLKPRFCDNLPQIDEHWCDPVYFIKTWERKKLKIPFYRSIIHGDLHSGNILIEMRSGKVWLIDFSHTGNGLSQERTDEALREERQIDPDRGHVLRDFCKLEADIKFIMLYMSEDDFNKAFLFEKELMARGLDLDNLTRQSQMPEVLRDPRFEKAWECIGEIRRRAKKYLHQSDDLRPYYLSLLHATLPIVYYEQCTEWQKKYALVSAGMLCDRLTS